MAEKIRIIGVPMDLGASRRGVDMGPSALRVAGLQARLKQLGRQVEDIGNVLVHAAGRAALRREAREISG